MLILIDQLISLIEYRVIPSQPQRKLLSRLIKKKSLHQREAKIMMSVIDRSVIYIDFHDRDELRARILKAMLNNFKI